jgi:hypothetical protein
MNQQRRSSGDGWRGDAIILGADAVIMMAHLIAPHRTDVCVYWNGNTRFQSLFMSTTVHLFTAAASSALSSFPTWDWRS